MISKVFKVYPACNYFNADMKAVIVPQIRLQGKWLETLGFTPNSKCQLSAEKGVITIKSIKEKEV